MMQRTDPGSSWTAERCALRQRSVSLVTVCSEFTFRAFWESPRPHHLPPNYLSSMMTSKYSSCLIGAIASSLGLVAACSSDGNSGAHRPTRLPAQPGARSLKAPAAMARATVAMAVGAPAELGPAGATGPAEPEAEVAGTPVAEPEAEAAGTPVVEPEAAAEPGATANSAILPWISGSGCRLST